ncbi:MAG: MFS transporter [Neisseriaceae bacterium]
MKFKPLNKLNITSIMAVLSGFIFYAYEYILRITPSVMEVQLSESMHVSVTMVGALGAYYYYVYTPMQIIVGIILDRYDIKRTLTIASLMCVIGTALLLISHSTFIFAFGRFIQGCGSAFAWVGILKLSALYISKRFYGLTTSFGSVSGFIGAAFGQVFLGFLVHKYGNTVTLSLLVFIGLLISYFIFSQINKAQHQELGLEGQNDSPMANKNWNKQLMIVLKTPYVWAGGIIAALLFTPTTVFAELWGIHYITKLYSYTPVESSFISSMIFIGWAIGCAISGALTIITKSKIKLIRYGSLGAFGVSFLILYFKLSYEVICFLCIIFGIFSSVEVLAFIMGRDVLPAKLAGITGSAINLICVGVGVAFQRLVGALLDFYWNGAYTQSGLRSYPVDAYKKAMLIIPLVLISCFIFTFFIDEKRKKFKSFKRVKS